MKVKLLGKNLFDIRPLLKKYNIQECGNDEVPELIITYGGDGALLGAERDFPMIPKLPLRDKATAPLCEKHSKYLQLEKLINNTLFEEKIFKVTAKYKGENILAINDIYLHNFDRCSALRYRVFIDDELYAKEVVGDGVGLSTPHGSTAYYRSITHSVFRVGIGLSFSNSTEAVNHLVLASTSKIRVEILRGIGVLVADNSPELQKIYEGDSVEFYQSEEYARIYALGDFMCSHCRSLRHSNKIYGVI